MTGSRANFRTDGKVKDIVATPAECWPVEPVLFDTSTPNIARVYDYWLGGKDNYALLEAAAWLHDIGYLPELAGTGLHALDGARYLRDVQHALPMLCRLVAHHSCAVIEAEERDLADALRREFEPPPQPLADALTFCDMTTTPDGEPTNVDRCLAEILHRYGSEHLVSRSIRRATPMILRAVGEVEATAR